MIQTHKLAALGEVVAGVAHEINNPVSFIAYNVPVLEEIWNMAEEILSRSDVRHPDWTKRGLSYEEVSKNMREIIEAFKIGANRISRVITSLKEFSRSDESVQKKRFSVSDVIAGALIIVGAQIRRTVSQINQEIDDRLPPVSGHFQKIEQVIANLLINAHQAIPPGRKGLITIRCRSIERLKAVVVDIEDNGKGIERKNLEHIFDPFFTTRRELDGTGLGLSISYGLVKEHQGVISVLSRPGRGSRFSVYLPTEKGRGLNLCPALLCIDHNVKYLKELKANFVDAVIWRSEPQDKVEDILNFLSENPEVDMIASEVRLKGFDGWELLEKIKGKYPLLPVIFYSADRKALKPPAGSGLQPDCILHKPFHIEKLQKAIHELGRQQL
jgi:CheY-like chemotaxis protein